MSRKEIEASNYVVFICHQQLNEHIRLILLIRVEIDRNDFAEQKMGK